MKRAAVLSISCVLTACAAVPAPAPVGRALPADALEVVRGGGDAVSRLRATFTARVRRGDVAERTRGVLLVSKPQQRFRMRLSSLLGLTILDYTSDAGDDRLWLATQERVLRGGEIADSGLFSSDSVRWIFLRERGRFRQGCEQFVAADQTRVECRDERGEIVYHGYVETASRLLSREVVFVRGRPRLTIHYRDYRLTHDVRLPYGIEWIDGEDGVRVEIDIDRYEVEPDLPAELFAPLPS